jgi:2-polyprenyl-3-methyl-5-hydroxy-6-metoxy-1,4-benzoquinol methylase
MKFPNKLIKLLSDPFGVLGRRCIHLYERLRFTIAGDYRTVDYWTYRHGKYGFDLRGVGDKSKTHEENIKLLEQGTQVFLNVCHGANVLFDQARVLDVGCGTGHFAEVLRNNGVKDYLGIDIVDTLFQGLQSKLPGFRFRKVDMSTQPMAGAYDLIIAMDILQHIANDDKFIFALKNIRSNLAPGGTIIISTPLGEFRRESFYFTVRPLNEFRKMFADFAFSEPIGYADSQVFSLKNK